MPRTRGIGRTPKLRLNRETVMSLTTRVGGVGRYGNDWPDTSDCPDPSFYCTISCPTDHCPTMNLTGTIHVNPARR